MVFFVKRLTVLAGTLLVVSVVVFLIPYLTPGDPARKILRARSGDLNVDPAALEGLRHSYGLDRPLLTQYWDWLGHALRGDLGLSYTSRSPVIDMVGNALAVTAVLAVTALLIALVAAL